MSDCNLLHKSESIDLAPRTPTSRSMTEKTYGGVKAMLKMDEHVVPEPWDLDSFGEFYPDILRERLRP